MFAAGTIPAAGNDVNRLLAKLITNFGQHLRCKGIFAITQRGQPNLPAGQGFYPHLIFLLRHPISRYFKIGNGRGSVAEQSVSQASTISKVRGRINFNHLLAIGQRLFRLGDRL